MFICYTDWLSVSRGPWCETENPSLCVCTLQTQINLHILSVSHKEKKSAHVVFHIKCSCATHCFPNLTQQEATAHAVTPLSTPSLSITHTHQKEATDSHLPSHHPSLFFFPPLRREVIILHYFQDRLTNRFIVGLQALSVGVYGKD